jgi:hypothetical protein
MNYNKNPIIITAANITTGTFTFTVKSNDRYSLWPVTNFNNDILYTERNGVLETWLITNTSSLDTNIAVITGTTLNIVTPAVGTEGLILSSDTGYYNSGVFNDPFESLIRDYIAKNTYGKKSYLNLTSIFTPSSIGVFESISQLSTQVLDIGIYEYNFVGTYSTINSAHGVGIDIKLNGGSGTVVGQTFVTDTSTTFSNQPISTGVISSIIRTTSPALSGVPILLNGIINITSNDSIVISFARSGASGTLNTGLLTWEKIN